MNHLTLFILHVFFLTNSNHRGTFHFPFFNFVTCNVHQLIIFDSLTLYYIFLSRSFKYSLFLDQSLLVHPLSPFILHFTTCFPFFFFTEFILFYSSLKLFHFSPSLNIPPLLHFIPFPSRFYFFTLICHLISPLSLIIPCSRPFLSDSLDPIFHSSPLFQLNPSFPFLSFHLIWFSPFWIYQIPHIFASNYFHFIHSSSTPPIPVFLVWTLSPEEVTL